MKRVKIVATLGPASSDPATILAMVREGMDAARINMAHGDHRYAKDLVAKVREAAERSGRPVAVVQDLAGPKIRVGSLPGGAVEVATGTEVVLAAGHETPPKEGVVPVQYAGLAKDAASGTRILLDDGFLEFSVLSVAGSELRCRVVRGGRLRSHKGLNLPGRKVSAESFTRKDRADLKLGIDLGVDFVAQSFVRSGEEVSQVKSQIFHEGVTTPIIAKIERPEALADLDGICRVADALRVARGDLGVELAPEEVPVAQKTIIRHGTERGLPVITATQMLESMVEHPRPTRAEASDVANAVLDGTAAVMLSEETALGAHAVEAVATMRRIVARVERARFEEGSFRSRRRALTERTAGDAIAHATVQTAADLGARAILTFTNSGATARLVSKYRPGEPILALTPNRATLRQMALLWGVVPLLVPAATDESDLLSIADKAAKESGLAAAGDLVVLTSGQLGVAGTTSTLRVHTVR
ncbi:MAG: pyruvate kinase [Methanobacteriota archaeon]